MIFTTTITATKMIKMRMKSSVSLFSTNKSDGWGQVLSGIQKVAQAAMQQSKDDGTAIVARSAYHFMEVASNIHSVAVASIPVSTKRPGSVKTSSTSTSTSTSTSYNGKEGRYFVANYSMENGDSKIASTIQPLNDFNRNSESNKQSIHAIHDFVDLNGNNTAMNQQNSFERFRTEDSKARPNDSFTIYNKNCNDNDDNDSENSNTITSTVTIATSGKIDAVKEEGEESQPKESQSITSILQNNDGTCTTDETSDNSKAFVPSDSNVISSTSEDNNPITGLSFTDSSFVQREAMLSSSGEKSLNYLNSIQEDNQQKSYKEESIDQQHIPEGRAVPQTRLGRAVGFASLGVGLAFGTAVEGISRLLSSSQKNNDNEFSTSSSSSSLIMNESNSDRLASTLCRMRGAALKMGQMLSIQDESLLPPTLSRALKQVRQGAEAMPQYQLTNQLVSQLGPHWKELFVSFDMQPFAAASIGQVHRATIIDETSSSLSSPKTRNVVVKVQYPGVAQSIESDLRNLAMLVTWTGLSPKGLFIENVIRVGEQELKIECDYVREMNNQRSIKELVESDQFLIENRIVVPDVYSHLCTSEVLTSEYKTGGTIDKAASLSQDERNRIGRAILYLTIQELFTWRIMQTDPNWGNFLYDVNTRTTSLIDFGATRTYSKEFVDGYLRIVWASANRDEKALMEQSYRMNFLTGNENERMIRAHTQSGYTVGEPFWNNERFDFRKSNISTRMGEHTAIFLQHRLTPPPEEVYTLHRKLAGAYMLCIKLGAIVECRDMLETVLRNHTFDDGMDHPLR